MQLSDTNGTTDRPRTEGSTTMASKNPGTWTFTKGGAEKAARLTASEARKSSTSDRAVADRRTNAARLDAARRGRN